MDDHVHMSLYGQAIVGRALFDGLTRVSSLGIPASAAGLPDWESYADRLGRNRFEGPGQRLLADPEVKRLYLGG